jgi:hypothetical protein
MGSYPATPTMASWDWSGLDRLKDDHRRCLPSVLDGDDVVGSRFGGSGRGTDCATLRGLPLFRTGGGTQRSGLPMRVQRPHGTCLMWGYQHESASWPSPLMRAYLSQEVWASWQAAQRPWRCLTASAPTRSRDPSPSRVVVVMSISYRRVDCIRKNALLTFLLRGGDAIFDQSRYLRRPRRRKRKAA